MRREMMGLWDAVAICKAPHSRQITTPTPHHSIFIGWTLFMTTNQQYQSTEGIISKHEIYQLTHSPALFTAVSRLPAWIGGREVEGKKGSEDNRTRKSLRKN